MENNQHSLFSLLKKTDPDRALLSFFAKNEARSAIIVVDLWNAELLDHIYTIRESHMALIRIQWWRDEISKIINKKLVSDASLLNKLGLVISQYNLSVLDFNPIFDGLFELVMASDPIDLKEILKYLHAHQAGLLRLKSKILGSNESDYQICDELAIWFGLLRGINSVTHPDPLGRSIFRTYLYSGCKTPQDLGSQVQSKTFAACQYLESTVGQRVISYVGDRQNPKNSRYFRAMISLVKLYYIEVVRAGFIPQDICPPKFKELRVWWES